MALSTGNDGYSAGRDGHHGAFQRIHLQRAGLITEPAALSMHTKKGVRILGIQIETAEKRKDFLLKKTQ